MQQIIITSEGYMKKIIFEWHRLAKSHLHVLFSLALSVMKRNLDVDHHQHKNSH